MRPIVLSLVILFVGCSPLEIGKTIWGSSTRALEEARANALTRTYDKGYWDCVKEALNVINKNGYTIFKKDEVKGYIVLMGIHGAVNTTEVGVFFVELSDTQTRIELSSLSTNAKRIIGKALFHGLDVNFGLVAPDPEPAVVAPADAATVNKI